ncbi:MAG TPA: membrane protein insertion efficiency factor YidD [Candidatus Sulfotelmatobacter sp.]|nr:membrane protein insertion efficiency factor YidD [Candidatus Sulfotelmatobacter sp.]
MRQIAKLVVLQILRAYKGTISPMLPPSCRFVPTCSEYAMEAVDRYGVLRGGFMALTRLLRCHPFAHAGYDPVVKDGNLELEQERGATTRVDAAATWWKSGALAPRHILRTLMGFSPRTRLLHLKRNA